MSQLTLILLCLFIGLALARSRKLPLNAAATLNGFVIWIALPALVLDQMHGLVRLTREQPLTWQEWATLIVAPWLVFAVLAALVALCLRRPRIVSATRQTWGALLLCAGLGNTSFLGLPLLGALRGENAVRLGLVADQLGTFFALSTAGVLAAGFLFTKPLPRARLGQNAQKALARVLTFPPFVALAVAVALAGWEYPPELAEVLRRLGATLVPLALVAVGLRLQLKVGLISARLKPLVFGLSYKLVLAPLMVALLLRLVFGAKGEAADVAILQSAMAPMITGAVVASEFGLDAELAELLIAIGIPLSLITVPVWDMVLRRFV